MAEATAGVERFREGDRVQVLTGVPEGNPRTPRYLRGWTGTIVTCHGIVDNPLDHQSAYPPLYSVVFPIPGDREPHDEVLADIHEEWLERAGEESARSVSMALMAFAGAVWQARFD